MKPARKNLRLGLGKILSICLAVLGVLGHARASHRPLLPRPQEVRYQDGELPLHGLSIQFAAAPDAGDRFTAGLLASGLSARAKTAVVVLETKAPGPAILLERNGEGAAVPVDNESTGPESREACSIQTTPQGAVLRARSSAGLFYAAQTLLQMAEGEGEQARLPAAEVRDWPALAHRGFMMDLSHGQLLRVSEIERQIDLLARFKANQYYFYSEASIELEGYETVNPGAGYRREQVRHLIDYARQRHVDVVPCLELYAHLHDLFRVEQFAALGQPRYGDEFDPRNPRVLAVIDAWVDQTANLFPSPWCHAGFDEPWSLGKIGMEPGHDPFKAFMAVLGHVAQRAQSHGKRLLFWADIHQGAGTLSNHPELVRELPAGVIAVPWVYEARTNYAPHLEPLAEAKVPTVVAPAVWNWNEIFPDYHRSFININGMAATGRNFGSLGILNTGWTDSAQTLYRQSLPGLALGAAAGWQSEAVDTNTFFADYAAQMYPAAVAAEVAPALEELSTVEEMFESILQESTQHGIWQDPLDPAHLARLEKNQPRLRQARLMAESALEHLLRAERTAPEEPTLNSLVVAARLFDYLGMKSLYAVEWSGYFRELKKNPDPELVSLYIDNQMNAQDHGMLADLTDAASGLREQYREAWLEESTPYRLGTALARWDAETQYWLSTWRNLKEFLRARGKDEPFPSIAVLRPKR